MASKKIVDYIIVGQGLAGSSLAIRLIQAGNSIFVYDEPSKNQCSRVAAGLFNPITGMRVVKTWLAEELSRSLTEFYTNCEQLLGQHFFTQQGLYYPFSSVEEQNNWMAKSANSSLSEFVDQLFTTCAFSEHANDPFGGILIKSCGYLDTPAFLHATKTFLESENSWREAHFDHAAMIVSTEAIEYEDVQAKAVIFCGGVATNPFFDWLNIRPLKGETLLVKLPFEPKVIFNRGVYIVPVHGTNHYKVGATYSLKDLTNGITAEAKIELTEKLRNLIKPAFEVTGQEWGIRPTTIDRRPMLGSHPVYKNLIIFNGLGTKGVSLAPYFSEQLANWLNGRGELNKEVNISRFNALYSKT